MFENENIYQERRTFLKWDDEHVLVYLNEEEVENHTLEANREGEEPIVWPKAYKYRGHMPDGGCLVPCKDPSDYGQLANAIIRAKYSESQEAAIHRHMLNGEKTEEYDEYNTWCNHAVALAKEWLGQE